MQRKVLILFIMVFLVDHKLYAPIFGKGKTELPGPKVEMGKPKETIEQKKQLEEQKQKEAAKQQKTAESKKEKKYAEKTIAEEEERYKMIEKLYKNYKENPTEKNYYALFKEHEKEFGPITPDRKMAVDILAEKYSELSPSAREKLKYWFKIEEQLFSPKGVTFEYYKKLSIIEQNKIFFEAPKNPMQAGMLLEKYETLLDKYRSDIQEMINKTTKPFKNEYEILVAVRNEKYPKPTDLLIEQWSNEAIEMQNLINMKILLDRSEVKKMYQKAGYEHIDYSVGFRAQREQIDQYLKTIDVVVKDKKIDSVINLAAAIRAVSSGGAQFSLTQKERENILKQLDEIGKINNAKDQKITEAIKTAREKLEKAAEPIKVETTQKQQSPLLSFEASGEQLTKPISFFAASIKVPSAKSYQEMDNKQKLELIKNYNEGLNQYRSQLEEIKKGFIERNQLGKTDTEIIIELIENKKMEWNKRGTGTVEQRELQRIETLDLDKLKKASEVLGASFKKDLQPFLKTLQQRKVEQELLGTKLTEDQLIFDLLQEQRGQTSKKRGAELTKLEKDIATLERLHEQSKQMLGSYIKPQ